MCKTLRVYQARLLSDINRTHADVLVEQPTGSGKTMQIVAFVAMQLGQRFEHALIAAPQEQIEQGFVHRDYDSLAFPACVGTASPWIMAPRELIWGARRSELGSVRRLVSYLRQPGPVDHALACTHAALNLLSPEQLPHDLSGNALFIDEAHHASADGLSQIVSLWRERGGQLYFFTATPYRADGRPVALDDMRVLRRSLAEHMADGFAPRELRSEIVALGRLGDSVSAAQFTGEETPPASYVETLVTALCDKWVEEGKPKSIVRVPPMRGGSSELVQSLVVGLTSRGARVLDATGTTIEDKQRFLAALDSEKSRNHDQSQLDVIVGVQRVMEGTDWPVCSAVYCVGMPGSLTTIVQLLGRAMRLKQDDYPASHRDLARLVFFVPCASGSALADLSIDHSRHALLTCCFLADHTVGQEWIVLREIRRGIDDAFGSRDTSSAAADAQNEADEPLDPEVRAEIELVIASAGQQIVKAGHEPRLGDVLELATRMRPDLPEIGFHRVATEVLVSQPGSTATEARNAIRAAVADRLRIDPMVKKAMQEAFAVVLDEFRAATLKDSPVLECLGRQVHRITGGEMQTFAKRLRDAAPPPLTEGQILAWADAHHERMGKWPKVASGQVTDAPGETWMAIHMALANGNRGLPGGSSLIKLLAEKRGVRNTADLLPLTQEQILAWADAHQKRTDQWPTRTSGPVVGANGESWANIDAALKTGNRGLPGGSSLAHLLSEHRDVRNIADLPDLTIEQIVKWADAHRERTGEWPKVVTGDVRDAKGETWRGIDHALRRGTRGLDGDSSLAQLLSEKRGVQNVRDLPPLSIEQILRWADSHYSETNSWPMINSGPIADSDGETWDAIHRCLQKGFRGLPGSSSLAKLLAEHRGAKNIHTLPKLTEAQILAWAESHHERTGRWPTQDSGVIHEATNETWCAVNLALTNGLRGLPGGSSLPKLLGGERNVRNRSTLPQLTIDQVLIWIDEYFQSTGNWPTSISGEIPDSGGETWAAINHALSRGSRGFAGGSSLAKLLEEQRGVPNPTNAPELTTDLILQWADAYYAREGEWPTQRSGSVPNTPKETWTGINIALARGLRGLPGGSSLSQLLAEHRGVRNHRGLIPLSVERILQWADAFYERHGVWPKRNSGPIFEAPSETWSGVNSALHNGRRQLPGGSSLAQLLAEYRGVTNEQDLPELKFEEIAAWAMAHHARTGKWPQARSGEIEDAPAENWRKIDNALRLGLRGLSGGSSLAQLITEIRVSND